jgi:PAS domain S-box-containing protein
VVKKASCEELEQKVKKLEEEILELKRKKEELQDSHEKYKALSDLKLNCIYIHDLAGNFIDANDAALNLLGYNREEIPSINIASLIEENQLLKAIDTLEEIKKTGSQKFFSEYKLKRKDGKHVWVETDGSLIFRNKEPYAVLAVARDITNRKRSGEALQESEERFREMAELMPETIFETDLNGNLTFVNRKAYDLFGYTPDDLKKGLNAFEMIVPEDRDRAMENVGRKFKGENIGLSEYSALRKDGSSFPILIHSAAIVRKNKTYGLRGFIIDHSERKQSEEERQKLELQFHQAQRLEIIGTLAGGIAHDFNNLLMAIQGNTSLMLFDSDSFSPFHGPLKNIEKQIDRGAKLTKQLLGYARKGKYNVRPISLNQIVDESSDAFGRTRKEITIQKELEKELFTIEADQGQIEQILYNLYVNAADAMPGGGKLVIKTSNVTHAEIKSEKYNPVPGNYISLTVMDTGIGIDQKIKDRIFEPFFTTKKMGRGTGLGLASVYGITKSHDGYIEVDSQRSTGTTFTVFLPASAKRVLEPAEATVNIIEGSGTILLIDDEATVLTVGGKILKKMGYAVLEARSGIEAIDTFSKHKAKIDLVILDMIMPDMGGGDTYDRIKEIDPRVKVLLSSGYSIEGQAGEIMKRGCDGFIQKPFTATALYQKLKEIIAK